MPLLLLLPPPLPVLLLTLLLPPLLMLAGEFPPAVRAAIKLARGVEVGVEVVDVAGVMAVGRPTEPPDECRRERFWCTEDDDDVDGGGRFDLGDDAANDSATTGAGVGRI